MNKRLFIRLIIVATVITYVLSCSDRKKSMSNTILEVNQEFSELSSLLKYVKKVHFIPLETLPNALIGGIVKVEAFDERLYLLDFQFSKSIFIYNKQGELINTISSFGKGPGEFIRPMDVAFDHYNNELIIVDPSTKKILKYDMDGNFISEFKLDFITKSIGFVDSNTYAFKTMDDQSNPVVVTTNHEGKNSKIVHSGIFEFNLTSFTHFPMYKGKQLYTEYLNDTIYSISKHKAEPWLYIDFLERKVTKTYQEELRNWGKTYKRLPRIDNSKAGAIVLYLETDEIIHLACTYNGLPACVWVNKSSKQQLMIQRNARENNPLINLFFGIETIDDSGKFISVVNTETFLDLFENDEFKILMENGIIQIEEEGFKNQRDVTLESNPVLAFIELSFPKY